MFSQANISSRPMSGSPRKFCLWKLEFSKIHLWNVDSWVLESGIQLKKSGIPLMIGFQTPSSTDGDWNPIRASGIHGVKSRAKQADCFGFPSDGAISSAVNLV